MTIISTGHHIVLAVSDESIQHQFVRLLLVLMLYQDIVIDPRDLVGVVVVGDVGVRALELNLVLAFLGKDSSSWESYLRLAKFSKK